MIMEIKMWSVNKLIYPPNKLRFLRKLWKLVYWGPASGMKWELLVLLYLESSTHFSPFHYFTLRNYGERDKTTAFLENKGPGPLADLIRVHEISPMKAYFRMELHRTGTNLFMATDHYCNFSHHAENEFWIKPS